MARPYGKFARDGRAKPDAPPQPGEIQVNITGRHTMEQLAYELAKALAMVEKAGVIGVEQFRFRLLPLDEQGAPMIPRDQQGQPLRVINIPDIPPEPPYRPNEPGIGVQPGQPIQPAATAKPVSIPSR